MRSEGMKSEEATDAAWEATKGGLTGAAKWGVGAAILGAAGYFWSPVYRGTTIQFKVYDLIKAFHPSTLTRLTGTCKCRAWCWEA